MQDPSQGVAQSLQNHVHLLSGHRYPQIATLPIEQLFKYLIDAPTVIKQIAPMAWTYVNAPQGGTVWLEWIPQHKLHQPYASDGYVWTDPETSYTSEFGGYQIESLVHSSGYRPQMDQYTQHARTRYHFVAKQPQVNAPPPDPSLWIVHYHRADANRIIPAAQAPMQPQMRQVIQERRWLESQGRLERKDFMLHDREHWPTINVPSGGQMGQPGFYGQNPMGNPPVQNRPYFPQQPGAPPAKRQRTSVTNATAVMPDVIQEQSIEEEENTAFGDFFDHLTPRDISMTRYKQHHQWMEEVFSSPYASGQIVPTDLGLGLMGQLKGLTEGILDPPNMSEIYRPMERPERPKEPQPFTNLKKEQLEEFNKRVEKHLEDGQAEIERMKAEHVAKMQAWKKTSKLAEAERKLRTATWGGHESAVSAFRLEEVPTNGHISGSESVDDIVQEMEANLGVKIASYKDAALVEKGGLERDENHNRAASVQPDGVDDQPAQTDGLVSEDINGDQGGETLDFTQAESLESKMPADVPQPTFSPAPVTEQDVGAADAAATQPNAQEVDPATTDMPDLGGDDLGLLDDMNMDVDTTGFDFDQNTPANGDDQALPPPDQPAEQAQPDTTAQTAEDNAQHPEIAATSTQQQEAAQAQQEPSAQPDPFSADSGIEEDNAADDLDNGGDTNLFNDNTFGDLADFDADDNDGLVDFDAGLENSAFGDAMHGMDDTPGQDSTGMADNEGNTES